MKELISDSCRMRVNSRLVSYEGVNSRLVSYERVNSRLVSYERVNRRLVSYERVNSRLMSCEWVSRLMSCERCRVKELADSCRMKELIADSCPMKEIIADSYQDASDRWIQWIPDDITPFLTWPRFWCLKSSPGLRWNCPQSCFRFCLATTVKSETKHWPSHLRNVAILSRISSCTIRSM